MIELAHSLDTVLAADHAVTLGTLDGSGVLEALVTVEHILRNEE